MELKSCPFCGNIYASLFNSNLTTHKVVDDDRDSFGYQCSSGSCGICGPEMGTEKEALIAWNTRPIESNLQEKLRVAVEALKSIRLTTGRYGLNESYRELDRKESVAKAALEQLKGKVE